MTDWNKTEAQTTARQTANIDGCRFDLSQYPHDANPVSAGRWFYCADVFGAPNVKATGIVDDPGEIVSIAPQIAAVLRAAQERLVEVMASAKAAPIERAATDANGSPVESVGPMDPQALAECVARSTVPAVEGA